MLKNLAKLEIILENRTYQLLLEADSPLQHVKEILFQFQKYIGQIEDAAKAQAEEATKQENSEQPKVE